MNDGDIDFLKTYVNMLELNAPDSEKLKQLIDEWPKEISIVEDDKLTNTGNATWTRNFEENKYYEKATFHKDGSFEMIADGPPKEYIEPEKYYKEQSKAMAVTTVLVEYIKKLDTTKDHKISMIKYLET